MAASRLQLNSEKSEVIWVRSNRTVMQHARRALQIGTSSISASDSVRLLGVLISADLLFDRHLTKVAGQCCVHCVLSVSLSETQTLQRH